MEETPKDTASRRVTRYGKPVRHHGPAIRELRKKDGWSQPKFAKAVGISQSTLSGIENERDGTSDEVLNRIRRKLHVPLDSIMREMDDAEDDEAPAEPELAKAS